MQQNPLGPKRLREIDINSVVAANAAPKVQISQLPPIVQSRGAGRHACDQSPSQGIALPKIERGRCSLLCHPVSAGSLMRHTSRCICGARRQLHPGTPGACSRSAPVRTPSAGGTGSLSAGRASARPSSALQLRPLPALAAPPAPLRTGAAPLAAAHHSMCHC